jgi:hypothetical protein
MSSPITHPEAENHSREESDDDDTKTTFSLRPVTPTLRKFRSGLSKGGETCFRQLIESLTLAPVLTYVPTLERGQTWLAAAATILDAKSFSLGDYDKAGADGRVALACAAAVAYAPYYGSAGRLSVPHCTARSIRRSGAGWN